MLAKVVCIGILSDVRVASSGEVHFGNMLGELLVTLPEILQVLGAVLATLPETALVTRTTGEVLGSLLHGLHRGPFVYQQLHVEGLLVGSTSIGSSGGRGRPAPGPGNFLWHLKSRRLWILASLPLFDWYPLSRIGKEQAYNSSLRLNTGSSKLN